MNSSNDRIVLKSVLIFLAGGLVWIFGVNYLLFEQGIKEQHLFINHLLDALFLMGAAGFFYTIIEKSYRRLKEANAQLKEHEAKILTDQMEIETLYERERHLRSVMSVVRDINAYLITTKSIDELGKVSCQRLARHSDYRLVWIGLIEERKIVVKYYSTDLTGYLDFKSLPLGNIGGETYCPVCKAIEEDHTVIINEIDDPTLPEKLRTAVNEGIYSLISLPLKSRIGGDVFGVINIYSAHQEGATLEEVAMLEELAGDIGFAIHAFEEEEEHKRLTEEKLRHYEQTLFSMIDLIESRDSYTAGHTKRVAHYSAIIAEAMGYDAESVEKLQRAAMLHDIGKIQTPDAILLKPGSLSGYEHELIQEHVVTGYNMLRKIDMYRELAEIMRHHHERHDGSGYPDGIGGEEIPQLSRIMIVADAFDAMTTSRIYKPRMQIQTALEELRRCAGSQFHPEVVEHAVRVLATVTLDPVHQLPTNRIDNERLAYFYKDKLTGTFSYDYLQVVLNNPEVFGTFRYACVVYLRGFSKLNREKGWSYGDRFLGFFGAYLNDAYPSAMVFRRFGDDFFILSNRPLECGTATFEQKSPIRNEALGVSLLAIDLETERLKSIDDIESYIAAYTDAAKKG